MNFYLATFFTGNVVARKLHISARRSADGYKSPQRNALRFIFCRRRRRRLFVAFSEREPFLRGFLCVWSVLPKSCIWVSRTCAKNFRRLLRLVAICYAMTRRLPLQIELWIALWWNGVTASIQW